MRPDFECFRISRPVRVPARRLVPTVMRDRGITTLYRFIDRVAVARLIWEQLTAKAAATGHHETAVPRCGQAHHKLDLVLFVAPYFAVCR